MASSVSWSPVNYIISVCNYYFCIRPYVIVCALRSMQFEVLLYRLSRILRHSIIKPAYTDTVADAGFLEGGFCYYYHAQIFEATPTFG